MPLTQSFLLLALAFCGLAASAQTVYRCGNSYGTQPCAGGTALDVTDKPSPADAAHASKVILEETRRADAMEKARLAQEKNAPKAIVIGPREPPPKPEPKEHGKPNKKHKKNGQEPEMFTATGPAPAKK